MSVIDRLRERFQILSTREKIIVTAAVIIGTWGIWDKCFWSPFRQKQNLLQLELITLEQQLSAQQQTVVKLESSGAFDPNLTNNNRLVTLNAQFADLQNRLTQAAEQFVPPRLMAKALNDMLNQNQQLTLLKLDTLPVTTLRPEKNQFLPVYKHGLALTFSGDYFNTLAYLKALESLSWRINWDSIEYQVKNYPLAETTIQAYTLSFEESWLGV